MAVRLTFTETTQAWVDRFGERLDDMWACGVVDPRGLRTQSIIEQVAAELDDVCLEQFCTAGGYHLDAARDTFRSQAPSDRLGANPARVWHAEQLAAFDGAQLLGRSGVRVLGYNFGFEDAVFLLVLTATDTIVGMAFHHP